MIGSLRKQWMLCLFIAITVTVFIILCINFDWILAAGYTVCGIVLLGLSFGFVLMVLQWIGFGPQLCKAGWCDDKSFFVHQHFGVASHVTTYLAYNGQKITYCKHCNRYTPPEGETIVKEYQSGVLVGTGGTSYRGPTMKYTSREKKGMEN